MRALTTIVKMKVDNVDLASYNPLDYLTFVSADESAHEFWLEVFIYMKDPSTSSSE